MTRVNLSKKHPAVYQQVASFSGAAEEAAKAAGLDPKLIELIKIRVSQINGCAFCLRLHTRDAVALGDQRSARRAGSVVGVPVFLRHGAGSACVGRGGHAPHGA